MLTKYWPTLRDLDRDFVELPLDHRVRGRAVGAITGRATVPQVFVNGAHRRTGRARAVGGEGRVA